MTRVNVEQTIVSVNAEKLRPAPPPTPPPPYPAQLCVKQAPLDKDSDDDLSTVADSPVSRTSSPSSSCSLSSAMFAPSAISRDELLCFRQRVQVPACKGLHCIPKTDPRLPVEKAEQSPKKEGKTKEMKAKPLGAPPGLALMSKPKPAVAGPPGLELGTPAVTGPAPYTPAAFRKEMMSIFKDLALDKNVGRAVRRVRMQNVPADRHAAEIADAVTYALEEVRGAVRRTFVAFVAGLVSAFEREKCIEGFQYFFLIGYGDLEDEVPKLSRIVDIELLPSLQSVFTETEMNAIRGS